MKTVELSREEMQVRIARFAALEPLEAQKNAPLPQTAVDLIYSRKLLSVIGLDAGTDTPINNAAPIKGSGGMTITLAVCPPGTGPSLHAHRATYETFTVLKSTFEFSWNDDGSATTRLEPFDTISIPPGVVRAFRNVGHEEGILQVIITGGVHDMNDIDFTPQVAETLCTHGDEALQYFQDLGFRFTAGS